jgi:uncharacterized protein (TIGR02996 family)
MQLRQALEDALVSNPDDLAAHSAYADFLTESSDPADVARGELIQAQLALERPGADCSSLEQRQRALLSAHGRAWLGEALSAYLLDNRDDDLPSYVARRYERGKFHFRRGWLDTLRVNYLTPGMATALAVAPAVRLLRGLEISRFDDDRACNLALAASPYLGNLRALDLEGEENLGHSGGEGLVDFVRRLPRLESLLLMVHGVDTEALLGLPTLTHLRQLQVYHVTHYPLALLAGNPSLSNLTHLLLKPHALEPGDTDAYIRLAGVEALVTSPHLTSLTHLELQLSDMGDEGCAAIARSGILARLEHLSLAHGRITDAGAHLLASCPDFRHLTKLDLNNNCLSEVGIAALEATGVALQANDQREPAEDEEIDEGHYLLEGDWE